MTPTFLQQYANTLNKILLAQYEHVASIKHNLTKGIERELLISEALRKFLPPQVIILGGQVFCSTESEPSKQQDILITRQDSPALQYGLSSYVPVEGVIATIEVKSKLDKDKLEDSLDKIHSVKRLYAESGGVFMGGSPPDNWHGPRGVIVAFDSTMDLSTMHQQIEKWSTAKNVIPNLLPDTILVLNRYSLFRYGLFSRPIDTLDSVSWCGSLADELTSPALYLLLTMSESCSFAGFKRMSLLPYLPKVPLKE